jgi:hypothetical protein
VSAQQFAVYVIDWVEAVLLVVLLPIIQTLREIAAKTRWKPVQVRKYGKVGKRSI